MPIPIIIAVLIALFTLGAKMNQQKGSPARVVIVGGKQYNVVDEKDNRNNLVIMAGNKKNDHTIIIKGQRETASFENIFQLLGLYQIVKAEPMTPINNSINSNMKQAVCLSEKE
ncbi:MAG TPA: hypothetical protein VF008_19655 [Niastella sp.]